MNELSTSKRMKQIQKLNGQRNELIQKLDQSLAIQKLWPECFSLGRVSSSMSHSGISYDIDPISFLKQAMFTIHIDNGDERTFSLYDIPIVLILFHLERAKKRSINQSYIPKIYQSVINYLKGEGNGKIHCS